MRCEMEDVFTSRDRTIVCSLHPFLGVPCHVIYIRTYGHYLTLHYISYLTLQDMYIYIYLLYILNNIHAMCVCVCNNRPRYSGAKQPATSHGPATETPRVGAETRLDWTDVYFCFLLIKMFDVLFLSLRFLIYLGKL